MSEKKKFTDEELDAIWKEMIKPEKRKPLTIEELRKMDGKPVLVHVVDHTVFADKEDDFDGYGLVRKSWVRVWDEKRADLIHVDYDFCGYGKEWLAYAYEPPILDRSAWETCEYCGEPSPHRDCVIDRNVEQFLCSRDGLFGDAYINTREINYCPFCGKPLTEESWKNLEKRLGVI